MGVCHTAKLCPSAVAAGACDVAVSFASDRHASMCCVLSTCFVECTSFWLYHSLRTSEIQGLWRGLGIESMPGTPHESEHCIKHAYKHADRLCSVIATMHQLIAVPGSHAGGSRFHKAVPAHDACCAAADQPKQASRTQISRCSHSDLEVHA